MKKPTPSELREFARSIGFTDFDPMEFIHYYDSIGWMVGKHKMKVWRAAVQTWKHKRQQRRPVTVRMPYRQREETINKLNRRKATLMREPQTLRVRQELEQIRMRLMEL
jgi:hypothetical protein